MFIQPVVEASTDPMSVAQGNNPTLPKNLPAALQQAIIESGLLEQGGDFSWLDDKRLVNGALYAHAQHQGKLRKRGGELRLIHEVWCLHQLYQLCKYNPWIQSQLAKEGVDVAYVMFGMATHDCPENSLSPYNQVITDLSKIWGEPASFSRLEVECYPFMTDANPDAPHDERVPLQQAKSYNAQGAFILTAPQQLWRMIDKWHHVFGDARYCVKQAALLRVNNGSDEEWDLLKKVAAQSLQEAKLKSFPVKFPLGSVIEYAYWQSLKILERTAQGSRDPSRLHIQEDFGAVKETVVARGLRHASNAWKAAEQRVDPLIKKLAAACFTL